MKKIDIINKLRELAPEELQDSWDNSGFMAGSTEGEVTGIHIALDLTDEVLENALNNNANMIITHHPMIFTPLKNVTEYNFISKRVIKLIKNDITYYAMHTNFDKVKMSELAADKIGMINTKIMESTNEFDGKMLGYGKIGNLSKDMNVGQLCNLIKQEFDLPNVKLFGDKNAKAVNVAMMPGAGRSFIAEAISQNVDTLITGDIDHHTGIDAVAQNLNIIDAGHYGIEHIFIEFMKEYINENFKGINISVQPLKIPFEII